MFVPTKLTEIGDFATELIGRCAVSMQSRLERGAMYQNVFLTGSADGAPQIYKKTYAYIDDLASMIYSPIELKLNVAPHGRAGPIERALGHAAAAELNLEFRRSDCDSMIEDAVLWALIKGKTFIELHSTKSGLEPRLIMPEQFGVLEEGRPTLASQKAFFHRTWITFDDFRDRVTYLKMVPRKEKAILQAAKQYLIGAPGKDRGEVDNYATTRMVMLGGLYPYQVSGAPIPGQKSNRGIVDWLTAPQPQLSPETRVNLIALDELWVWDSAVDDWVTIQLVGPDCVLIPNKMLYNALADNFQPGVPVQPGRRSGSDEEAEAKRKRENNPLRGRHPFVEFCIDRMPKYFWGDSEIRIVGSIQAALNRRMDGINKMLRKEENPPRLISGSSINQNLYAKQNKPGGYLTDQNPNAKAQALATTVPADSWRSLHELMQMFNDIGGMPATVRGEGESGVRAQAHAETLVRMASPRFKDKALAAERCVDAVAGLALDILKVKSGEEMVAWVPEKYAGLWKGQKLDADIYEPPAPGLVPIPFVLAQLDDNQRVSVDAHSSSPMFSKEARDLIFALAKLQAVSPRETIELTHPPREDELVEALETREAEHAAFIQAHPQMLEKGQHGGRRH